MELDYSVCCIKGCDLPTVALGLCNKHWRRTKKYGSPMAVRSHSGLFVGKPPEVRFQMQYKVRESGCWEWTGARDADGYGSFVAVYDGVTYKRAHRWSWAHHNKQQIPQYGNICHACDNPSCVNPAHLWLGTAKENQQDKWAKGRANIARGEAYSHTKLTADQVRSILLDPRASTAIAADYGISPGTISDIKRRKSWSHLEVGEIAKHKRVSPRKGVSDKVTPEIVREIRSSSMMGKDLAEKFGVSKQLITDIRKRRSWAHVED